MDEAEFKVAEFRNLRPLGIIARQTIQAGNKAMSKEKVLKSVAIAVACAAVASSTAFGIMKELQGFRAPHGGAKEAV